MDPTQDPRSWPTEAANPGSWSSPAGGGQGEPYPGSQPTGGYPGSQPGYPGSQQPGYPGSGQQDYPGGQPGYPGPQQPGYPGSQQGYPGSAYPSDQQYGAPAQPGYPGTGGPWAMPGGAPPKKRRGLVIGAVVAGVVVVAGAVVGIVVATSGASEQEMLKEAGKAIAPAKGMSLSGTVGGSSASFGVTKAGTGEGTYTDSGSQLTQLTIKGTSYLKAPSAFWSGKGISSDDAQAANGNWAKAESSQVDISFSPFSPSQIASILENAGTKPDAVHDTYNGKKVLRLLNDGTYYDVTTDSPYTLVHMSGTAGQEQYSLGVTALTTSTVSSVFTTLHGDVSALQNAADPNATFTPDGVIAFAPNCQGASACTVNAKAIVSDTSSTNLVVKMVADFSSSRDGTPFGSCSDTVTGTSDSTVDPACTLGGSTWSNWVNSHKSNFTTWADPHFTIMVNTASDVSALQGELTSEQSG